MSRRDQILAAARTLFGERGFDGATMRGIAAAAGVDVALISYHFGSKDQLFAAAMKLPINPVDAVGEVFEAGMDGAGERLVATFLQAWENPELGSAMLAMFRSAASHEQAGAAFGQFVSHRILGRYRTAIGGPDAERRANVVATQLVGLAMLRYVLRVEPLAGSPRAQVVADFGPVVQGLLTGPLDRK